VEPTSKVQLRRGGFNFSIFLNFLKDKMDEISTFVLSRPFQRYKFYLEFTYGSRDKAIQDKPKRSFHIISGHHVTHM